MFEIAKEVYDDAMWNLQQDWVIAKGNVKRGCIPWHKVDKTNEVLDIVEKQLRSAGWL